MAREVVLRYLSLIMLIRAMTSIDVVLLRWYSVGTSQQGSCPRYREGYVDSISALTAERLALVGIL
jgi:hypothetical protein